MTVSTPRRVGGFLLKARDPDPHRSAAACELLGAVPGAVTTQRDTYFQGPRGRLKLREDPSGAWLFAYERFFPAGQREPRQWLFKIAQPDVMLAAFAESLGVEAVVVKRRRAFLWEGCQIHLDAVRDLGSFVKLVPGDDADPGDEGELTTTLRQALGIAESDLLEGGYCDLLLASESKLQCP